MVYRQQSLTEEISRVATQPVALASNQRFALISVTDKSRLEWFMPLIRDGWTILSTGGTAKALEALGIPVTMVEHYTGFPEMMDGRLKTLHPKVHGGLLAVTSNLEHAEAMIDHAMVPIDLLAVNLYDFAGNPGIEQIDVGGPAMIRAAAKNHERVTVLTDPSDYSRVVEEFLAQKTTSLELRKELAKKAFAYTAAYDAKIAAWL